MKARNFNSNPPLMTEQQRLPKLLTLPNAAKTYQQKRANANK